MSVPAEAAGPRFRYLLDPLCLVTAGLYVCNRLWWKPLYGVRHPLLAGQFNDLLFLPVVLPPFLWLLRRLNLRDHDRPPLLREILVYGIWWTVIIEGIGPFLLHRGVADWRDVLAYAIGGALAMLFWRRHQLLDSPADLTEPAN